METIKFFEDYTEAYDKIMCSLSVYGDLLNLHKEALVGKNTILESGCGVGRLAIELLKQGSIVYGLDQNQRALDLLDKRAVGYRDRLYVLNRELHKLPFEDEFFDGISSMLVLHFMDTPIEYLREHARVLKKNGIFVVSGPDEKSKEDVDMVVRKWKEYQERMGSFDELIDYWNKYEEYTMDNVDANVKNWFSIDELSNILEEEIGFRVLSGSINPIYYRSGYVIVAEKNDK